MKVLKVKMSGQRIKYEVMKVSFKDSDLMKAKRWKWDNKGSLYYTGNRLDILRDYDTFETSYFIRSPAIFTFNTLLISKK